MQNSFVRSKFEPSELNAAKFCEVVYRVLQWHAGVTPVPLGKSISNFPEACRKLESTATANDTVRFHIPRAMVAIYNVRNKRGVGHVGGDVDPNLSDASLVMSVANWVLAELIRMFHNVTMDEATEIVSQLASRTVPWVWTIGDTKRLLRDGYKYPHQVLLLLYAQPSGTATDVELFEWTEYSNRSSFKSKLLTNLHRDRLVEYSKAKGLVHLSPKGSQLAEELLAE